MSNFKRTVVALSMVGLFAGFNAVANDVVQTSVINTATAEVNSKVSILSESLLPADAQAFKKQLQELKDGETLVVPAGKYADMGVFEIKANNVTIKAEKPGTVWFTGLVQVRVMGSNNTIDGVVFTEGGPAERMGGVILKGAHNTLQNSTFYFFNDGYEYLPDERRSEYPKYLWVGMYGKHNALLNNTFEGKHKRGTLIGVQKEQGDTTADHHVIKGNLFYNQKHNQNGEFDIAEAKRYNSNSWEAIRLGDSKSSIYNSSSLVEGNLFLQTDGETELISLKSGDNVVRGNTIIDSASMISMRHGKNNTVEDNVIIGNGKRMSGGIRFYDEGHTIRNNYIERVMGTSDVRGGLVVNTGITDVMKGEQLDQSVKGKELNKQATVNNVLVENNTVIDSAQNILYSDKMHRVSLYDSASVSTVYAGHNLTFRNNISYAQAPKTFALRGDDSVAPLVNPTFENNVYFGEVTGTTLPEAGVEVKDPKFKRAENGLLEATAVEGGAKGLTVLTMQDVGADYRIQK
ncbi:hypothetical protein BCU68_14275 [Vibrio sp. 10N.286.49.B3]|uniref:polysaccharide lyase 6 family protein n=1 Tax=Vibrio sp. 10N.286.49.B3 TaxID=1880855 RepID=UPI000C862BA8|nr:polysaccharide lyase 6 family protein [Vibrio sp. 10N.286.49.B3]PMH42357.1 hypothetical protein BCU68_14275 [Vibrio sp. 10N.286.49.B3]